MFQMDRPGCEVLLKSVVKRWESGGFPQCYAVRHARLVKLVFQIRVGLMFCSCVSLEIAAPKKLVSNMSRKSRQMLFTMEVNLICRLNRL